MTSGTDDFWVIQRGSGGVRKPPLVHVAEQRPL